MLHWGMLACSSRQAQTHPAQVLAVGEVGPVGHDAAEGHGRRRGGPEHDAPEYARAVLRSEGVPRDVFATEGFHIFYY